MSSFGSYAGVTYGKTASVLLTLEGIIGQDTMAKAMHTYFMKYRFTHPVKEDFLKTIEEVSGKDLRWYFNQAVYGSQVLDYEILKVDSFPAEWYLEKKDKKDAKKNGKDDTLYQSYVTVHRKEDFIMPVEVEIKFDNGEKIREHWDGQSRWTRFSYLKKAKVVSAEIDPDHTVQTRSQQLQQQLQGRTQQQSLAQSSELLPVHHPIRKPGLGMVGGIKIQRSGIWNQSS